MWSICFVGSVCECAQKLKRKDLKIRTIIASQDSSLISPAGCFCARERWFWLAVQCSWWSVILTLFVQFLLVFLLFPFPSTTNRSSFASITPVTNFSLTTSLNWADDNSVIVLFYAVYTLSPPSVLEAYDLDRVGPSCGSFHYRWFLTLIWF